PSPSVSSRQRIVLAIQPVVLNHYVLAPDVAGFAGRFSECSGLAHGGLGRPALDEAHNRHCRLLRARRERPRSHPAEQRDERATAAHSITSSARNRNDSGIVSLSTLAVVRLRARSNFLGCSTGRSPGFAPGRILST